jgi:hypothetical protein
MHLFCQERSETALGSHATWPLAETILARAPRLASRAIAGIAPCLSLCLGLAMPTPALASDEAFELWIAPSVRAKVDDDTGLRLETAQRFRNEEDGRQDTYFVRMWVSQKVSRHFTVEGAVERRENVSGRDETRLLQQVVAEHGIFRNRVRLEQRFIDDTPQTGWRLRSEHGVRIDLDAKKKWFFRADAEFFFTLQNNNIGGQTGFTEQRSQAGIGHRFSPKLTTSLSYKRVQTIRQERPDLIGHVPMIHIDYSF